MKLVDMIDGLALTVNGAKPDGELPITGISCDSRAVKPGFLFAALPGSTVNGVDFVPQALANGASVVLVPREQADTVDVNDRSILVADNPRQVFAQLAARLADSQPATIAAVTGTNGKTSVVSFLKQFWNATGLNAAGIGTLGCEISGPDGYEHFSGSLTTPDPVALHNMLRDVAGRGIDHLALEASSHGLDQYRLDGVRVSIAAFTNLSHDHLDYHGDERSYFLAKKRLFDSLLSDKGTAVINADIPERDELVSAAKARGIKVLDYGRHADFVRLVDQQPAADGQRVKIIFAGRGIDLRLPLIGAFQASNVLCAFAMAIATGCDPDTMARAIPTFQGVRGRLEHAGTTDGGAQIYVDYAHTPDALAKALAAVRPHTRGKVHVVFGCGGDRDKAKRKPMGEAACRYADVVTLTDDNPRTEDPEAIREQALLGCPGALNIGDRRAAISNAIDQLSHGDILVVAGKGHEQGQLVGEQSLPFDDVSVVREVLSGEVA